jgi:formamidopyrimidine-DNA glycosylase
MPELPEVETVARGLRESLVGSRIAGVEIRWPRTVAAPDPAVFAGRLRGRRIVGVGRRGKWLRLHLDGGQHLLIHLRMSGRLLVDAADAEDDPYARLLIALEDGRRLRFSDVRKFGRMVLTDDDEAVLGDLGPEPLSAEFTPQRLAVMLARRRGRLKPLLLNQRFLAGLGNIYVDETLWRARLHPLQRANELSAEDVARLHHAIQEVLRGAIDSGGTTLPDTGYVGADGQPGAFAGQLAVYGRSGEPCLRCGVPIERIVVGQRGTCFCPHCQPG